MTPYQPMHTTTSYHNYVTLQQHCNTTRTPHTNISPYKTTSQRNNQNHITSTLHNSITSSSHHNTSTSYQHQLVHIKPHHAQHYNTTSPSSHANITPYQYMHTSISHRKIITPQHHHPKTSSHLNIITP